MSVRSSILAVLSLGPAYGLQVHAEIEARTARAGDINVGQIYSTLTRLKTAHLVTVLRSTDDGLPLYQLTPDGRAEAERWLTSGRPTPNPSYHDMVNHLLLAASLPGADLARLVDGYRATWAATPGTPTDDSAAAFMQVAASAALGAAAEEWLNQFEHTTFVHVAYSTTRPKRGRRPSVSRVKSGLNA